MQTSKYILIYKQSGANRWIDADNLALLKAIPNMFSWMTEYKIINTKTGKEVV